MPIAIPILFASLLLLAPPAGRPPEGPVTRHDPQRYDFTLTVSLITESKTGQYLRPNYGLKDAPIAFPLILNSTWSRVDIKSLSARMWLNAREDESLNRRTRMESGLPFHTHLAILPIKQFRGNNLRWQVRFQTRTWSSRVDEAGAEKITWPRKMPAEVQDGLKPQTFIQSDSPIFKQAVQDASNGQLRLVPPYLAAKELIRYCIKKIRISGDGIEHGSFGEVRGFEMQGALATVQSGVGGPHDLLCVCIAILRASGIPARPVLGLVPPRTGNFQNKYELSSWGEFYLPKAGWIPFDPMMMRHYGSIQKDIHKPWPGLGTIDNLNKRIPLAFHFTPEAKVYYPIVPTLWGWNPRPGGDPGTEPQMSWSVEPKGPPPPDSE